MIIFSKRAWLWGGGALLLIQAGALFLLDQPAMCTCGYLRVWEGAVLSIGNSQHLTDWYTFSHIIHGFVFYLLIWFLFPRAPITLRFLLALGIEVGWEIAENTPFIINHYREQALAQGYVGDSIINSISDSLAMIGGFVLAWRLPIIYTILLALAFEFLAGFFIHDNLVLNILNFIHQFEFIREWQNGAV